MGYINFMDNLNSQSTSSSIIESARSKDILIWWGIAALLFLFGLFAARSNVSIYVFPPFQLFALTTFSAVIIGFIALAKTVFFFIKNRILRSIVLIGAMLLFFFWWFRGMF